MDYHLRLGTPSHPLVRYSRAQCAHSGRNCDNSSRPRRCRPTDYFGRGCCSSAAFAMPGRANNTPTRLDPRMQRGGRPARAAAVRLYVRHGATRLLVWLAASGCVAAGWRVAGGWLPAGYSCISISITAVVLVLGATAVRYSRSTCVQSVGS